MLQVVVKLLNEFFAIFSKSSLRLPVRQPLQLLNSDLLYLSSVDQVTKVWISSVAVDEEEGSTYSVLIP